MSYKIVIPSAGIGARIGPYSKFMNKALVTVGDKPAISRVIDKFANEISIVILKGYKGDMVEEVVKALHPDRNIEFIEVDKYEGTGSGLGYSLLQAKDALQCPFIFIPNDTLVGDDNIDINPESYGNWAAYYEKQQGDLYNPEIFRTLELDKSKANVVNILGKGTLNKNIYIGTCGVKDYQVFWSSLSDSEAIEVGEVYGLNRLSSLKALKVNQWYDCGSLTNLSKAKQVYENKDHNILEKEDESIWFTEDQVIKFSVDQSFIRDRVKRVDYLPPKLLPELISSGDYTYKYLKEKGSVIADELTPVLMEKLLNECQTELWSHTSELSDENINTCYDFYKEKTYKRIDHYLSRFEQFDHSHITNGKKTESVKDLLATLDWKKLCGHPHWSKFHGDFHGENILYSKKSGFCLLDWRQNFGEGNYKSGDAYYDFAKLNHGLIVNHGIVNNNQFTIKEDPVKTIFISIDQKSNLIDCQTYFFKWLKQNGYDPDKVKLLTALIFLNICGLHEFPYARYLYLLGQFMLQEYLDLDKKE